MWFLCQCRAVDWELGGVEAALELIWPVSVQSTSSARGGWTFKPTPHPTTWCQPEPSQPYWRLTKLHLLRKKRRRKMSEMFITTCNSNTRRCWVFSVFFFFFLCCYVSPCCFLWWLRCFFICYGCVLLGYLNFDPDLSEIRGVKSPGEACLKVKSCYLYWKTVYLSSCLY